MLLHGEARETGREKGRKSGRRSANELRPNRSPLQQVLMRIVARLGLVFPRARAELTWPSLRPAPSVPLAPPPLRRRRDRQVALGVAQKERGPGGPPAGAVTRKKHRAGQGASPRGTLDAPSGRLGNNWRRAGTNDAEVGRTALLLRPARSAARAVSVCACTIAFYPILHETNSRMVPLFFFLLLATLLVCVQAPPTICWYRNKRYGTMILRGPKKL